MSFSSERVVRRARPALWLLLMALVAVMALAAAPAGARVVTDSLTHKKFGIVPTTNSPGAKKFACNAENSDCTALTYNGGPVQHSERVYLFFWAPRGHGVPPAYRGGMASWLNDMAGGDYTSGNPFSVNQQYYDKSGPSGAKNFVPYGITDGGTIIDTTAYPTSGCPTAGYSVCLTNAQLAAELSSYLSAHSTLPRGIDTEYFILTPNNVLSCFDSGGTQCAYTSYCGYHTYTGTGSTQIVYADMPWSYNTNGCDVNLAFGMGYANADAIDPVVGVFSHELSESMTDPNLNAWYQNGGADNGYEIGDKCAYIYGAGGYGSHTGLANNGLGYWNVTAYGDQYLMQLEFDNRLKTCERTDTDTQPSETVSISPNPPVHGSSALFTAHVTASLGVAYVTWNFGDGTTGITQGSACTGTSPNFTCTISHTYTAAHPSPGIKTNAVVTDGHGNEKVVVTTITVS
jgi:hypothetical protein